MVANTTTQVVPIPMEDALRRTRSQWRSLKPTNPRLEMELSPGMYRICWFVVMGLHACEIAFLVATVWFYQWAVHNPIVANDALSQLHFSISLATLGQMMWIFAVVAAVHAIVCSLHLWLSVRRKSMRFFSLLPSSTSATLLLKPKDAKSSSVLISWMIPLRSFLHDVFNYIQVTWIDQVFSIHGKYFDHYFVLHEVIEMAAQIYQAYQMSQYIAARWINHVVVMMIVINGISSPIIHVLVPASNEPLRRLGNVIASALLNLINSMVIPWLVFHKYIVAWDTTTSSFPVQYIWSDVWYANGLRENQQVWVTSVLDFLATLAPHLSMLDCLWTCANIVRRQGSQQPSPRAMMIGQVPVVPSFPSGGAGGSLSSKISKSPASNATRRLQFFIYNALWLSGLLVLGLHIQAQLLPRFPGCRLGGTPWLTRKSSCVLADVNCHRFMVEGNKMQIDFVLSQLNGDSTLLLTFMHCPKLQVPPRIREFHGILNFEIYNCTIDEWKQDASIELGFFPSLVFVNIVRTNLSSIPPGLSDAPVASNVGQVLFHETNLTTLPPQIEESWASVNGLAFEFCQFEQVPQVLYRMQATATQLVSFRGNPITTLSNDDEFRFIHLRSLSFSRTPLAQLPTHAMSCLDQVEVFYLGFSQLTSVPSYIRDWYFNKTNQVAQGVVPYVAHTLFGSPYCAHAVPDDAPVEEQIYQSQVCSEELFSEDDWYPMEVMEPQRQCTNGIP